MIKKEEVMPLLLKACPSFQKTWDEYLKSEGGASELLYMDLGWYAEHIVNLYKQNKVDEFVSIFNEVEKLHVDGDDYVKEAATIGLLEDIQNRLPSELDYDAFVQFLGPVSRENWFALIKFWMGGGTGMTKAKSVIFDLSYGSDLLSKLRKLFNKYNPIGIYDEELGNDDEYDPEIIRITKEFNACFDVVCLQKKIYDVFKAMFSDDMAGNFKQYEDLSKDLYALLEKEVDILRGDEK